MKKKSNGYYNFSIDLIDSCVLVLELIALFCLAMIFTVSGERGYDLYVAKSGLLIIAFWRVLRFGNIIKKEVKKK